MATVVPPPPSADAGLHHHGNSGANHEVSVPPQSTISLSPLSTTVPSAARTEDASATRNPFGKKRICGSRSNRDASGRSLVAAEERTAKIGELLPPRLPRHPLEPLAESIFQDKLLILLVGAQGLEPLTR